MKLLKLSNEELSFAWELPYYFDENGFLIVSSLDPQLDGMKDGWYWYGTSIQQTTTIFA